MEETDWDSYGTGNYEKCADCMVHSGYEATAVMDSVRKPWKAAKVALRGVKTEGEMAPEIALERQRPAQYVFSEPCREGDGAPRRCRRRRLAPKTKPRRAPGAALGGLDQRRQSLPRLARDPEEPRQLLRAAHHRRQHLPDLRLARRAERHQGGRR